MGQPGLHTHWRTFGVPVQESPAAPWQELDAAALSARLAHEDAVPENETFQLCIVAPDQTTAPFDKAIVLLHGLNERRWDRYLPWAAALVERLRRPVVLFPIAFHMQRAPTAWSDPHRMHGVSSLRRRRHVGSTSFANAALSARLESHPERFYWSGVRTIEDLSRLAAMIGASREPLLRPDARIDLFGYSVGAFLSVILLASAQQGVWAGARLFGFCGGCTLADCNPVSKEILDETAAAALRVCFDDGLEQTLSDHPDMARSFEQDPVGRSFRAMLHPNRCEAQRRAVLGRLSGRITAIALAADRIMPAAAIEQTLSAAQASCDTLEMPFACGHTRPFGARPEEPACARAFESVFDRAASWLE